MLVDAPHLTPGEPPGASRSSSRIAEPAVPRVHPLFKLLLVATVLVDAVVFANEPSRLGIGFYFALALIFSQTSLIGIWAVLFPGRLLWRLPLVAAAVAIYSRVWLVMDGYFPWVDFAAVIGFHVLCEILMLTGLRQFGIQLSTERPLQQERNSRSWSRYSLGGLLLVTTMIAVLIACGRLLAEAPDMAVVVIVLVSFSLLSVGALWLICGTKRIWLRGTVFAAIITSTVVVLGNFQEHPPLWVLVLSYIVLMVGSLGVLRLSGYRLVRDRSHTPASPDAELALGDPELASSGSGV